MHIRHVCLVQCSEILNIVTSICVHADSSELMVVPSDLTVNFLAEEGTNFTIILTVDNNNLFEGFHSFVLALPTDSDYIIPREDDFGTTTIIITDINGKSFSYNCCLRFIQDTNNYTIIIAGNFR